MGFSETQLSSGVVIAKDHDQTNKKNGLVVKGLQNVFSLSALCGLASACYEYFADESDGLKKFLENNAVTSRIFVVTIHSGAILSFIDFYKAHCEFRNSNRGFLHYSKLAWHAFHAATSLGAVFGPWLGVDVIAEVSKAIFCTMGTTAGLYSIFTDKEGCGRRVSKIICEQCCSTETSKRNQSEPQKDNCARGGVETPIDDSKNQPGFCWQFYGVCRTYTARVFSTEKTDRCRLSLV